MRSHLNVGGKYRDQKCDEADAGRPSKARDEHAGAAENFAAAADLDEQRRRGQPRRNDPRVKGRVYEMVAAGGDKEDGEQRRRDAPPEGRYLIGSQARTRTRLGRTKTSSTCFPAWLTNHIESSASNAASSRAPSTGISLKMSTGEITSTPIATATSLRAKGTRVSRIRGTVRKMAVFAASSKRINLILA
jgi:hypothetical protein